MAAVTVHYHLPSTSDGVLSITSISSRCTWHVSVPATSAQSEFD